MAGKLPLVGGIVAGLVLGAAVGMLVLGPRLSAAPAPAATSAVKNGDSASGEHAKGEAGGAGTIYQMDNLVLNPAGSGGTRFLLLGVALEVKDEAASATLKARDAELRDNILRLFGSKTVEQVSEASARDALRAELKTTLDKILPPGTVRKVYFPQFVIQ
jgi:flagellar FliL protein